MRYAFALTALLASFPALAQRLPAVEADQYERCMALAKQNPEAGRDMARRWVIGGGAHPDAGVVLPVCWPEHDHGLLA